MDIPAEEGSVKSVLLQSLFLPSALTGSLFNCTLLAVCGLVERMEIFYFYFYFCFFQLRQMYNTDMFWEGSVRDPA